MLETMSRRARFERRRLCLGLGSNACGPAPVGRLRGDGVALSGLPSACCSAALSCSLPMQHDFYFARQLPSSRSYDHTSWTTYLDNPMLISHRTASALPPGMSGVGLASPDPTVPLCNRM